MTSLPPRYYICPGSPLDRSLLVKFVQRTYQEVFSHQDFGHLAFMVDQHLSSETPLWWVKLTDSPKPQQLPHDWHQTVACVWAGTAVDQGRGKRHPHIFLLYVAPEHRRQGIGKALMQHVEAWAVAQGNCQISLQVFLVNQPAINLYQQLGYQTESLWLVKRLLSE